MSPLITKGTLPSLSSRLSKVHILVVDDDLVILNLVHTILKQLGFGHVTTATDGSEAIALLKDKRLQREQEVDLIITDWNMSPVNGIELMRFVRTSKDSPNPYIPIIMLSGRGEWADVELARDAGFSEYLIKPFNVKTLCERILLCVEIPRAFVATESYTGPSRRRREADRLPEGMATERRVRNAENALPGKALKGKIGFDINLRQVFTRDHIEEAQEIIDKGSARYRAMGLRDAANMMHILRNAMQFGTLTPPYAGRLRRLAFTLKCQAGTYGYSLGSQVAKSLLLVIDTMGETDGEKDFIILSRHIETLQAIFQEDMHGQGGATGAALLDTLNALIRKYKSLPPAHTPREAVRKNET